MKKSWKDYEYKYYANGTACITHISNNLVTANKLTRMHNGHLHVAHAGLDAISVVQGYEVTEGRTKLGHFHNTISRSVNRGPALIRNIDTLMHLAHFASHRVNTGAK